MAQSDRRSLLSTLDSNAASMSAPRMGGKSRPSSRPSMIPRQSVLPARVTSASGQENVRVSSSWRNNIGMSYPAQGSSTGMDIDVAVAGPSLSSTPYRGQVGPMRRVESASRPSVAQTPNTRKSLGGRQSLAPRPGGNLKALQPADPRPIREDRQLLMRMETEIQDFLSDTGYVFPAKYSGEFHMPSQALVMGAFRHIYHQCIDLKYAFVAEPKKEVEEVLQLMGDIKYPFMSDLSKTKLSAPGSIHNWPPICGMLHWMLCVKSAMDLPTTRYHGGPLERKISETDDDDFCHYHPYLWLCYEQFWDDKDDFPELTAILEETFDRKSKQAREELEQLRERERHLMQQLKMVEEQELALKEEENLREVLEKDIERAISYNKVTAEPKILQCEMLVDKTQRDSQTLAERLQRLREERDILQEQVDAQNVSANDFEQLAKEREKLASQLQKIMTRLQEQSGENSHTEVLLSNKQSRVEDELRELSDKCRSLDFFPYALPGGGHLNDFDIVTGNTNTLLPKGLDLKVELRKRIGDQREMLAFKYREAVREKTKDQENYDVMMEEVEDRREEVKRLETNLRTIKEQTDLVNAASKEEARIQADVEANSEMALAQLDQTSRTTLDQAESRLQSANMQMNLVRDRDEKLREELHQKYVAGLETILALRSLVTEGLESLKEAAETYSGET